MPRRRTILSMVGLTLVGMVIVFFDPIHTTYSAATDTPRSWIRSSSPMREHLRYVWENWDDPKLSESAAVRELTTILQAELSKESTSDEIGNHIRAHFQKPVFESMGAAPATQWRQDAHGYTAFFMDDYKVLHVRYFSRNGHFLYADISMGTPKGQDLRQIDLTPSVDLWAFSASHPNNGEQSETD